MINPRIASHPTIAIVGSGANGTNIDVDIVRAGHDVTVIDQWPDRGKRAKICPSTRTQLKEVANILFK